MNLLMVSGDASPTQGRRGAFLAMLEEFSQYWDRVDVIAPTASGAKPVEILGNVHFWPSQRERLSQIGHILSTGGRLARERHYALIASHDYGFFFNGIGSALLSRQTRIPYVSEIHHVEGHPRAATFGEALRRRVAEVYLRWARDRAIAFRVVNETELPELLIASGIRRAKIRVLHSLYLDFNVLRPAPTAAPREYDALFAGRLAPNKGLFLFVGALAQVRRKRGSVRAAIVGDGPLKGALLRRIESFGLNDAIVWPGWQATPDDLAELYRRSRCLVCASYSEGGPRVVVEALACGTPVISTPVGMAREIVRDGENGFLFDWSADELAGRLLQLLADEDLRCSLGAAGPESVARFEKKKVIREYAMAYQQLARRAA
ncbi:MAG: glycosyltransferase [Chloroflexi bacterium]|nr:glycosyltransferase [Chloroflexota bacterium]